MRKFRRHLRKSMANRFTKRMASFFLRIRRALEDALGLPIDVIHAPLPEDSMIRPGKVVRVL